MKGRYHLKIFIVSQIFAISCASYVFSEEASLDQGYAEGESSEESLRVPRQKPQGQNFFDKGKSDQNFFGDRNMSSSSIFSADVNSSVQMDSVIKPKQESVQAESFDVSQQQANEVAPTVQESSPNQEILDQTEVANSGDQSTQALSNIKTEDVDIQRVLEHSRKIRQAIFGEEAAKMLPKEVADKLKSSQPAKKTEEMRF